MRSASAAFWQSVRRFQSDKVNPWVALRNTIGIVTPIALGIGFGQVRAGIAVATGALNVSYSDNDQPYIPRAQRMLAASALVAMAVFTGTCSGGNGAVSVSAAGVWAFAAGMMVALGGTPGDLGVISLVTLVVYAAVPLPPAKALFAGFLALSGGTFQTLLSLAPWPLRRHRPERRALDDLYRELAHAAATAGASSIPPTEAPPASLQSSA